MQVKHKRVKKVDESVISGVGLAWLGLVEVELSQDRTVVIVLVVAAKAMKNRAIGSS
jgi:hypothetical protein